MMTTDHAYGLYQGHSHKNAPKSSFMESLHQIGWRSYVTLCSANTTKILDIYNENVIFLCHDEPQKRNNLSDKVKRYVENQKTTSLLMSEEDWLYERLCLLMKTRGDGMESVHSFFTRIRINSQFQTNAAIARLSASMSEENLQNTLNTMRIVINLNIQDEIHFRNFDYEFIEWIKRNSEQIKLTILEGALDAFQKYDSSHDAFHNAVLVFLTQQDNVQALTKRIDKKRSLNSDKRKRNDDDDRDQQKRPENLSSSSPNNAYDYSQQGKQRRTGDTSGNVRGYASQWYGRGVKRNVSQNDGYEWRSSGSGSYYPYGGGSTSSGSWNRGYYR